MMRSVVVSISDSFSGACSNRLDEILSRAASNRFPAARRARYARFNWRSTPLSVSSRNIVVPNVTGPSRCCKTLHLAMMLCTKSAPAPRGESGVSPYLKVGIGTPNIRVDRFLRFAVRFRLVFFAFRFLAM
jgi:hypothetical protein